MMNKNVEAFKKYYDNATKEQVIEDMFLDICNLQTKIDKAIEYINKYKQIYDIDGSIEHKIDEFNILASPNKLIEILGGKEQ